MALSSEVSFSVSCSPVALFRGKLSSWASLGCVPHVSTWLSTRLVLAFQHAQRTRSKSSFSAKHLSRSILQLFLLCQKRIPLSLCLLHGVFVCGDEFFNLATQERTQVSTGDRFANASHDRRRMRPWPLQYSVPQIQPPGWRPCPTPAQLYHRLACWNVTARANERARVRENANNVSAPPEVRLKALTPMQCLREMEKDEREGERARVRARQGWTSSLNQASSFQKHNHHRNVYRLHWLFSNVS